MKSYRQAVLEYIINDFNPVLPAVDTIELVQDVDVSKSKVFTDDFLSKNIHGKLLADTLQTLKERNHSLYDVIKYGLNQFKNDIVAVSIEVLISEVLLNIRVGEEITEVDFNEFKARVKELLPRWANVNSESVEISNPDQMFVPLHDNVKNPKHYMLFDIEAIQCVARSMTLEQFKGFCMGSAMKYRLRAGKKDDTTQDINKALEFESLYEQYKGLCYNR